jgi:hypothetical protein
VTPELVAVAVWAALVVAVHVWGRWLQARGHRLYVNLPPLVGHLDVRLAWEGSLALATAPVAVAFGCRLADRSAWRRLLWIAFAGAAAWAVALALTEGVGGILRSPASPRDYLHDVPLIPSVDGFLREYVDQIGRYTTHVRAHPPGMVLVAWSVSRMGGGPAWLAVLEIVSAASAVPAALVALRDVAGEARARAAAPFLVFAPAAVTIASSGDAFFTGVGAWGVALVILATRRRDRRSDLMALGGGWLLGVTAFLSYGLLLLGLIPLVVALARRRARPITLAIVGAAPVFAVFWLTGFGWLEGLAATAREYAKSVARFRPLLYFVVANIAALGVVLGPAGVAGLARARERGARLLVGGAALAVAIADLSGMSKAEVERIWLPFIPWLLVATGWLAPHRRRTWLGLQIASALALELAVTQPW